MDFIKAKLTDHFNKLLLAALFIGTVAFIVHLIHKQAAGTDENAFIVWAEAQAAFILTKLVTMITGEAKDSKVPELKE